MNGLGSLFWKVIVCLLAQRTFGNKFIRATLFRVVTYSISILFNFISYVLHLLPGTEKTPEILGLSTDTPTQ